MPVKKTEVPALGQLTIGRLPEGSCGLLLWTRQNQQPRLVFRSVVLGQSMTVLDGIQTPLTLQTLAGDQQFNVHLNQTFTGEIIEGESEDRTIKPVAVSVRGEFGQQFTSGVYVENALITVTGEDGWERVTPAAGLAGCRP